MKKTFALLLVLSMLLVALVGCGETEADNSNDDASANNESVESTESTEASDDESSEAPDNEASEASDDESSEAEESTEASKDESSEAEESTEASEDESSEAEESGELLDAPEAVFDDDAITELYISYTIKESGEENDDVFAIKQVDEDLLLFYVTRVDDTYEYVFEMTETTVVSYFKDSTMAAFQQEELTDEQMEDRIGDIMGMLETFTMTDSDLEGAKYEKLDDVVVGTGDAYAYNVIIDDEKIAKIYIDKESGMLVNLVALTGEFEITVNELKTSGVEIPQYK